MFPGNSAGCHVTKVPGMKCACHASAFLFSNFTRGNEMMLYIVQKCLPKKEAVSTLMLGNVQEHYRPLKKIMHKVIWSFCMHYFLF